MVDVKMTNVQFLCIVGLLIITLFLAIIIFIHETFKVPFIGSAPITGNVYAIIILFYVIILAILLITTKKKHKLSDINAKIYLRK